MCCAPSSSRSARRTRRNASFPAPRARSVSHRSKRDAPFLRASPHRTVARAAPFVDAPRLPEPPSRHPPWLTKARFPPSCAITAPAWSRCVPDPSRAPCEHHRRSSFRCAKRPVFSSTGHSARRRPRGPTGTAPEPEPHCAATRSTAVQPIARPIAAGRARGRSPPRATLGDAPGFARDPSSLRSKKARRRKPPLVDH